MMVKEYMQEYTPAPGQDREWRPRVGQGCHVADALRLWPDEGGLDVVDDNGEVCGTLSDKEMTKAAVDMFAPSGGTSLVELVCQSSEYSASKIAMAVEDTDAPLLGMWSRRVSDNPGKTNVLLMIGAENPASACRSLRRYGYEVMAADASGDDDMQKALENLSALKMYLEL